MVLDQHCRVTGQLAPTAAVEVTFPDGELRGPLHPVQDLSADIGPDVERVLPRRERTTRNRAADFAAGWDLTEDRSGGDGVEVEHQLAKDAVHDDGEVDVPKRSAIAGLVAEDDVEVLPGCRGVKAFAVRLEGDLVEAKSSRALAVAPIVQARRHFSSHTPNVCGHDL